MFMSWNQFEPFIVALAAGLLIGLERERSHARELPAGSRSFALLALFGALAASLGSWVVVVGLAAVMAIMVLAYFRTSEEDVGSTTEIAAMVTYLLGALSYTRPAEAAGLAVIVAGLLVSKTRIHHFAHQVVTGVELEDAIKFFVVAFVVLPLLPDRGLGPYGALNPAKVWLVVVLLTGISWTGLYRCAGTRSRTGPSRNRPGRRIRVGDRDDCVHGPTQPRRRGLAGTASGGACRQPRHVRAAAHRHRNGRRRSASPALASGHFWSDHARRNRRRHLFPATRL